MFAIEKDPKTLKCAKHNAEIYGVANKIFWLSGDCFEAISRFVGQKNTIIFASPPWGGERCPCEIKICDAYNCRHQLR